MPDQLRFTQKLPNIVEIQVFTNYSPRGSVGATMGKTFFTSVYTGKYLLQNQQANFNQTWYKSPLGKQNLGLYKSRARFSSKGKQLQKCKNIVWVIRNLLLKNHIARKA
jgi:hypothetical protein